LLLQTKKAGCRKITFGFFMNKKKTYTKSDLPTKICAVCGRPFAWRKKWEKVWAEVKYCSDKCRLQKKKGERGD
jgi:hypothetical protein